MRVLVTGATGYIGSRLVPRLVGEGHQVRCLARDPSRLDPERLRGAAVFPGDALDSASLGPALQGMEVGYYLIHSMNAGEAFEARDRQAAQNFATAAREAGLKRLIYLGGLGDPSTYLSDHLKSRQETGEILRRYGPPLTEFRAAIIVGSGSVSFEMIRYLTERIPVMICPRWVVTRCQPISIRDVLAYLTAALTVQESTGKTLEIGGSDVLTYGDMMMTYAEVRRLRRWLVHVPLLTPRLSSYWVDLVTPIPASIARPLIQGLSSEVICRTNLAGQVFPAIRPMGYRSAVQFALERLNTGELESIWSGSFSSTEGLTPPSSGLKTTEGMILDRRESVVQAPVAVVYRVVSSIGGQHGWFYANWLWRLRALLDRLAGGVGMRRGRRDPYLLKPGDPVDFWRVEAAEPNRLLRLRAEMKLPGRAWLQMETIDQGERTLLRTTAFFEPRGLAGHFYWWAIYPLHMLIFNGLNQKLRQRAQEEADSGGGHHLTMVGPDER